MQTNKRRIFFGAGSMARNCIEGGMRYDYIVDNDECKQGTYLCGVPVFAPRRLYSEAPGEVSIDIGPIFYKEIAKELSENGFVEGRDFFEVAARIVKPRMLAIELNHLCNARCVMCNIWKDNDAFVPPLDQFERMMGDEFFGDTEILIVSGGEITLLNNVPEYVKVLIKLLPRLASLALVTNGLLPKRALEMSLQVKELCCEKGIPFSVSVSLDGLEEFHDANRGVKGAYQKTSETYKLLKQHDITVRICSTVTTKTIYGINAQRAFLENESADFLFQWSEQREKLGNLDGLESVNGYSPDEMYEALLFFSKLAYEGKLKAQDTGRYKVVIDHMLGRKRTAGCLFVQGNAMFIGHDGELFFCPAKSADLGSLYDESAFDILRKNSRYKEFLVHHGCLDCAYYCFSRYDSGGREAEEAYWERFFTENYYNETAGKLTYQRFEENVPPERRRILLVGPWGYEGVVQKAALSEWFAHNGQNGAEILIASRNPFITERTLSEIGESARVVPTHSDVFLKWASTVDEIVVFEGDPPDSAAAVRRWALHAAAQTGVKQTSVSTAKLAKDGIARIGREVSPDESGSNELACFIAPALRESRESHQELAHKILDIADENGLRPYLYSLCEIFSADERDDNYRFAIAHLPESWRQVEAKASTLQSVIRAMKNAGKIAAGGQECVFIAKALGLGDKVLDIMIGD